jgi:hypothetical protein
MQTMQEKQMISVYHSATARPASKGSPIVSGILAICAGWILIVPSVLNSQESAASAQSSPASPNPNTRMFWKNPYSGSMTDEEVANSQEANPPIFDAKWEHEACTTAYAWQVAEPEFLKQLEAARDEARARVQSARRQGALNAAQASEAWAAIEENMAKDFESWRERAATFTKNIPKCRGTFFLPAALDNCESSGSDLIGSTPNPFCMAARGTGSLEGVFFTNDKLAMGHSVAWNALGVSSTDPHGFRESNWAAFDKKDYVEPAYPKEAISLEVAINNFEVANDLTIAAKNEAIEAALASEYRIIMRGAEPASIATGEKVSYLGSWYVSLEMIRIEKSDLSQEMLDQIQSLSAASGIPWDLGDYSQYPRLHFQANIPDVLIQAEAVWFQLGNLNREDLQILEAPASFELIADGAPAMKSSYQSKRVHAASIPTVSDWAKLRDPANTHMFATTFITIEDGSIDQIDIPLTWIGFRRALADLTKVQTTVAERTIQVTNTWNSRLAGLRAMSNWYQTSLQNADTEARALLATRKPLDFNCSSFPSTYGDATNINRLADERIACQERWTAEVYFPHWKKLQSLRGSLARGGFTQTLQAINQEIERWESRQTANLRELQNFNLDVAARNRQIREAPPQQAQPSSMPSTSQTRYSDAWQRGQQRRRNGGPERDYAAEFYERQRNPPPLTQYPPIPVRRPPSYFRPGYY